jgi:pyruvate formate lyase activating enzyme
MIGNVFDIQRFSIHDGPGIRTTVFLKGCSLRCFWCHNPEGLRRPAELQFLPARCIACGACLVCPQAANELRDGALIYHRERCEACGQCVETCYAEGRRLVGRPMTVEEVMQEALRDRIFYETSGGGVTLSGGEPALQPEFSRAILVACQTEGIHTAIETAGNCAWDDLAMLLPATDLVMMDLKHMDAAKHRAATGVSNERILENARRLAASDKPLIFRIPIVPTVNDTPEEVAAIACFVRELGSLRAAGGNDGQSLSLELLMFHRLASDKYTSLGLIYRARDLVAPTKEQMAILAQAAAAQGVAVCNR